MMETRLKEVLAVVNNKGGVGKTTTVQSLAVAMKREHKDWRILVIDLDPQGDLSKLYGVNKSYSGWPTITDAPFKANRSTNYTGNLFVNAGGFALALSGEWSDDYVGAW